MKIYQMLLYENCESDCFGFDFYIFTSLKHCKMLLYQLYIVTNI